MERDGRTGVQPPVRRLNPTLIVLLAGVILVLGLVAYFATNRNPNQDKLSDQQIAQNTGQPASPEKRCSSQATYDLIKRDLFRNAGQARGSDQSVYDQVEAYAVVRMENAVLESEDSTSGALNCSGSLSIDLPPGVQVAGGRRTLTADVDYTIDASGNVTVRNAEAITAPLATLARVEEVAPPPAETNKIAPETDQPETLGPAPLSPAPLAPTAPRPLGARPSFDCADAHSRGEIAVCSSAGLAALDRTMAAQYRRSLAVASPAQRQLLQQTRDRFLAYRDRCPNNACIGDAYTGRMREIRDIMEGRLQSR